MFPKNFLMHVVNKQEDRNFCVKRGEEGYSVLRIYNYIIFSSESKHIVQKRPEVNHILSSPPHNLYTVYDLISGTVGIVAAKNSHTIALFYPSFREFMNIALSSSGPDMTGISPVKYKNS